MNTLVQLWETAAEKPAHHRGDEVSLAVAALLIEVMGMDGRVERVERDEVNRFLGSRFELDDLQLDELIETADREVNRRLSPQPFAAVVRSAFSITERLEILAELWRVALIDHRSLGYEEQLLQRIAEFLGIDPSGYAESRARAVAAL